VVYRWGGPRRTPTSSLLHGLDGGCIKSRASWPVGSREKARAIGKKGIKMRREREKGMPVLCACVVPFFWALVLILVLLMLHV
jgi:hypothetical protein